MLILLLYMCRSTHIAYNHSNSQLSQKLLESDDNGTVRCVFWKFAARSRRWELMIMLQPDYTVTDHVMPNTLN